MMKNNKNVLSKKEKLSVGYTKRGVLLLVLSILTLFLLASVVSAERIIFLHHSVGGDLINYGDVREDLSARGHEFYDHGYNGDGLRLANGRDSGRNFDVPGDNTDPDGFAEIFSQQFHTSPDNTFSHLMEYDVIIFKSCFPTSNIGDEYHLNEYKRHYTTIRDRIDEFSDKIFIVVTPPPQVPPETNSAESRRARDFANWLKSDEYIGSRQNLFVFDFFDQLADSSNVLKSQYRQDEYDAHPNPLADRTIGPIFSEFVDESISSARPTSRTSRSSRATEEVLTPQPVLVDTPSEVPEVVSEDAMIPVENLRETKTKTASTNLFDFEKETLWTGESGGENTHFQCSIDSTQGQGSSSSLKINYNIAANGYAHCGNPFDVNKDLSSGDGISFWIKSDSAGSTIKFLLFSEKNTEKTPFEISVKTTKETSRRWTKQFFTWDEFSVSAWADTGEKKTIDPAQISGIGIVMEELVKTQQGTVWVDTIRIYSGDTKSILLTPEEEEIFLVEGNTKVQRITFFYLLVAFLGALILFLVLFKVIRKK